jgi:hypothetical protein
MTLIMTMLRPEGVWQSADNRVIRIDGSVRDDATPKQLHIKYFTPTDSHMLLAFTGLAGLADGTPTLRWIRETLRGEARGVVSTLESLSERLTRDVSESPYWNQALVMAVGVFEGARRFYAVVSNCNAGKVVRQFDFKISEVTEPRVFVLGTGRAGVRQADEDLLLAQGSIRPAKWEDHLGLLAKVNRLAAKRVTTVSPWCTASFVSADSSTAKSRSFAKPDEPSPPYDMQLIVGGIDVSDWMAVVTERTRRAGRGEPPPDDADAEKEALRRATRRRP